MNSALKWIRRLLVGVFARKKARSAEISLLLFLTVIAAFFATQLLNAMIFMFPSMAPKGLTEVSEVITNPSGPMFVSILLVVCVVAPVVEEIIFRGILWKISEKLVSTNFAWIFTSILFALAHLDILHIIAVFPLGILFGYLRKRSGSIWAPMLAHAVNNILATLVVVF